VIFSVVFFPSKSILLWENFRKCAYSGNLVLGTKHNGNKNKLVEITTWAVLPTVNGHATQRLIVITVIANIVYFIR